MLRRLTLGLSVLAAAIAIAACSSKDSTVPISVGPNFPSQSLYATNVSQNAISIYPPSSTGGAPQYQIGGSSTTIVGPQYLAFDSNSNLLISNFNASTSAASILEIKALATGNVIPFNSTTSGIAHPRGLATYLVQGASDQTLVVANTDPAAAAGNQSQLVLYDAVFLGTPYQTISGSNTQLDIPSGVAASGTTVYVTNLQSATVEGFAEPTAIPSPTATPVPTATPTATPTPNPSATPSATPTPVPTVTPNNQAPSFVISGAATGLNVPTGIAVDGAGNMYVSDQGTPSVAASILVFGPTANGNVAPVRKISGSATKLFAPTDVKLDSSGKIYVADSTSGGAGVIYVFAAGATGNVAPAATYTSPGSVIGIGLTP